MGDAIRAEPDLGLEQIQPQVKQNLRLILAILRDHSENLLGGVSIGAAVR
jgi:hypothetical protein